MSTILTPAQQKAVLDWPKVAGIGIFQADTKNKKISLKDWPKLDLSKIDYNAELASGKYDNGIAGRLGKTLSGEHYAIALDFDGWEAVAAWFGTWERVQTFAQKNIVEWHQDRGKIHVILLSEIPVPNRKIHIKDAFLEIRCEGQALFLSPSVNKDGNRYVPLGTNHLTILSMEEVLKLKSKIDSISEGYMSDVDKDSYDKWLDLPATILGENQGRHDATKFKIIRYYWKYENEWLDLTDDQRFERAWQWHIDHCKPPRPRHEFNKICEWTREKFRAKRDEVHKFVRNRRMYEYGNGNGRNCQKSKNFTREYALYKYSKDDGLAEEIILDGRLKFLQIIDGEPKVLDEINLGDRKGVIIKPHHNNNVGLQATLPFEYSDIDEIRYFIELARRIHIDDLYVLVKSIWTDLVSTDENELITILAADTIVSYFQEQFVTTHYLILTGPPGWGKGAILLTFKLLGYRVVLAGDMSGANLLDILGPIEKCQVCIAEDEFDNIHDDPDKERIYKMGYEDIGFVTRTVDPSSSERNIRYYNPYCFKIFASEETPDSKELGGFNDRTFRSEVRKGKPKFLVKETKKQMERAPDKQLPKYRTIISRINKLRKLLLIYKLIHHGDTIEEINTNIDSRALELCGPALRLFNSQRLAGGDKKALTEVKDALSHFLRKKGELDKKTIEIVVLTVINRLFNQMDNGENEELCKREVHTELDGTSKPIYTLTYDQICTEVMIEVEGTTISPRTFEAADYGKVSHDSLLQKCRSIFKGQNSRLSDGKIKKKALRFDKTLVEEAGRTFDVVRDIQISDDRAVKEEEYEDPQITSMWNDLGGINECTSVPIFDQNRRKGQAETNEGNGNHEERNVDETNLKDIPSQYVRCRAMPSMPIFPPNDEKLVHWYTRPNMEQQLPQQEESRTIIPVAVECRIESDSGRRPRTYKLYEGSDLYGCEGCKVKGDKWYMEEHNCRGLAGHR
ncbi:MAG: hypothetical protein WA941_00980 [Nitrososphaeraceae archaeon]